MRYPLIVPGLEGYRVEVETAGLVPPTKVLLNGSPAPPGQKRGEFRLPRPDGTAATVQLLSGFLDHVPRVTVDGVPQTLAPPLNWAEKTLTVPADCSGLQRRHDRRHLRRDRGHGEYGDLSVRLAAGGPVCRRVRHAAGRTGSRRGPDSRCLAIPAPGSAAAPLWSAAVRACPWFSRPAADDCPVPARPASRLSWQSTLRVKRELSQRFISNLPSARAIAHRRGSRAHGAMARRPSLPPS